MNYLKIITMLFIRSHGNEFDVTKNKGNKLEMVSFI